MSATPDCDRSDAVWTCWREAFAQTEKRYHAKDDNWFGSAHLLYCGAVGRGRLHRDCRAVLDQHACWLY
jgi:hypothetical protein